MGLLSAFALMRPIIFAWCGRVRPIPCGALRWARCECICARDFSGLGSWSPAIIFIAGDHASFLISFARAGGFPTCTDARESARILEAFGTSAPV